MFKPARLKCRDCGEEFDEMPGKRGYRNQCPECSEKQREPELLGGVMRFDHKTAPYIELMPLERARIAAQAGPVTGIRGTLKGRQSRYGG